MRMIEIQDSALGVGEAFDADGDLPIECVGGNGEPVSVYLTKEEAMELAVHIVMLYSCTNGKHSDAIQDAGMELVYSWHDLR